MMQVLHRSLHGFHNVDLHLAECYDHTISLLMWISVILDKYFLILHIEKEITKLKGKYLQTLLQVNSDILYLLSEFIS